MYDDSRLRFAHWAAEQGIDPLGPTAAQIATLFYSLFDTHGLSPQMVKGYGSCLVSVLFRTGRAAVFFYVLLGNNKELDANPTRMVPGHCSRGFKQASL